MCPSGASSRPDNQRPGQPSDAAATGRSQCDWIPHIQVCPSAPEASHLFAWMHESVGNARVDKRPGMGTSGVSERRDHSADRFGPS